MPTLKIELNGHLMIASDGVAKQGVHRRTYTCAARDGNGGPMEVPYIPATALRGAVRMQMEALLLGIGKAASGPFPREGNENDAPLNDLVARLFGYAGRAGEREGSGAGMLRFGDALPDDPEAAAARLRPRVCVAMDPYTGTAADEKLFFNEECAAAAKPLTFTAELWIQGNLAADERMWLRGAVQATTAIGANKTNGGGAITIKWCEEESKREGRVTGVTDRATRARLTCKLLEPAAFGDGGMVGNHRGTILYPKGSTLRGAIAWALLRKGCAVPEDGAFSELFLNEARPVSFGDGLPLAPGEEEPRIRPATVRKARAKDGPMRDILVAELARDQVNEILAGSGDPRYLRTDYRGYRPDPVAAYAVDKLVQRTRTRVSLDRYTGTAAAEKLFSFDYLDRWQAGDEGEPVRFVSWIENLTPRAANLLDRLRECRLVLGYGRNHGMGLVEPDLRFETEPSSLADPAPVFRLGKAVEQRAALLLRELKLKPPPRPERIPLVIVAKAPFVAAGGGDHPLSAWEQWAGTPVRCFLNHAVVGGYDQRPAEIRGVKTYNKPLSQAAGAGSVFVYRPEREQLEALLAACLPALRKGVGERQELGCGRFHLYEEVTA